MNKHIRAVAATVALLVVVLTASMVWRPQTSPVTPEVRTTSDPAAERYSAQANRYFMEEKYSQSVDEYKKSLQIQQDADVKISLATALLRAGRRDEAIKTLREVAQTPDRPGNAAKKILDRVERDPQWGLPKR